MVNYKGFYFLKTYGLEDYISKMHDDLVSQFDEKAQRIGYFKEEGFALFLGQEDEKVYRNLDYKEHFFSNLLKKSNYEFNDFFIITFANYMYLGSYKEVNTQTF